MDLVLLSRSEHDGFSIRSTDLTLPQTSDSYLVLVTVIFHPDETIYQAPPLSTNAQRNFLAGPGEAFPLSSVSLQFEGVIRVEGTLIRCVKRLSISTLSEISLAYLLGSSLSCFPRRIHQRYSEYLGQHQKKSWGNEDLTKRSMERGGGNLTIMTNG